MRFFILFLLMILKGEIQNTLGRKGLILKGYAGRASIVGIKIS